MDKSLLSVSHCQWDTRPVLSFPHAKNHRSQAQCLNRYSTKQHFCFWFNWLLNLFNGFVVQIRRVFHGGLLKQDLLQLDILLMSNEKYQRYQLQLLYISLVSDRLFSTDYSRLEQVPHGSVKQEPWGRLVWDIHRLDDLPVTQPTVSKKLSE